MRLLFLTARPPWPSRRGDQARTAGWVAELAKHHTVRVVAQAWPGLAADTPPEDLTGSVDLRLIPARRGTALLGLAGALRRPLQVALHRQPAYLCAVCEEVESFAPDVVVVVLSRLGDAVLALRKATPNIPIVLDLVDALSLNMERRAARQPLLAPLLRWEGARMRRWDRRLLDEVATAVVVAERDRDALATPGDPLFEKIHVLPFGLRMQISGSPPSEGEGLGVRGPGSSLPSEVKAPEPSPPSRLSPEEGRSRRLVLTGNLGYFPTVDGATWLAREVWPRLREHLGDGVEWLLAGARPTPEIQRLGELPGVQVVANPDDLASLRRSADIALAPLRAGSGTPIKILEAMVDGIPVVTTSHGRAGLDGAPAEAVATADDGTAFAAEVVRLLESPDAATRQANVARRWVEERHALEVVASGFEALLRKVAAA